MADNNKFLNAVLSNTVLLQLGEKVLAIIHARTLRGEFLPGSDAQGYSTKPAPMPFAALEERIGKGRAAQVLRGIKNGSSDKIYTSHKSGKVWITLQGGYKQLRALTGREIDRVTLNWRGTMLNALKAKADPSIPSVSIYFTNREAEKIAGFHHEGAGRNKIKRLFMGLTQQEQIPLEQWLGSELTKRLQFIVDANLKPKSGSV